MKKGYLLLLMKTVDTEAVQGYSRVLYRLFYDILEKGLKKGELKDTLSAEELSRHFVMAFRGLSFEWCTRYPDFDLKKQAVAHTKLLIQGICINVPE